MSPIFTSHRTRNLPPSTTASCVASCPPRPARLAAHAKYAFGRKATRPPSSADFASSAPQASASAATTTVTTACRATTRTGVPQRRPLPDGLAAFTDRTRLLRR